MHRTSTELQWYLRHEWERRLRRADVDRRAGRAHLPGVRAVAAAASSRERPARGQHGAGHAVAPGSAGRRRPGRRRGDQPARRGPRPGAAAGGDGDRRAGRRRGPRPAPRAQRSTSWWSTATPRCGSPRSTSAAPRTEGEDFVSRITLRLPPSLKELVESAADRAGESVNAWVVDALGRGAQQGRQVGQARSPSRSTCESRERAVHRRRAGPRRARHRHRLRAGAPPATPVEVDGHRSTPAPPSSSTSASSATRSSVRAPSGWLAPRRQGATCRSWCRRAPT